MNLQKIFLHSFFLLQHIPHCQTMNDKLASINRHSRNVDNDMVETILALYNKVKLPIK